MKNISELIYKERVTQRITQSDLANMSGCSTAMICCIEKEKKNPSTELLIKICCSLEISKQQIFLSLSQDLWDEIEKASEDL